MSLALVNAPPIHSERRLEYQKQDSALTLAQGLEEYYRANAGRVFRPNDLSQESRDLFRSHDMCHVIFGLDTNLTDEVMADTRTLLSCDVGVRQYARNWLRAPEARAIYKEIGLKRFVVASILAVPRVVRGVAEYRKMLAKWPWQPKPGELTRSLAELRREYGIRVI